MSETIGDRYKRLVDERGLTDQRVAELAGTSIGTVYNLKGDKRTPELSTVVAVAKALDVTPQYLLFGEEILRGYTVEQAEELVRRLRRRRGRDERGEGLAATEAVEKDASDGGADDDSDA